MVFFKKALHLWTLVRHWCIILTSCQWFTATSLLHFITIWQETHMLFEFTAVPWDPYCSLSLSSGLYFYLVGCHVFALFQFIGHYILHLWSQQAFGKPSLLLFLIFCPSSGMVTYNAPGCVESQNPWGRRTGYSPVTMILQGGIYEFTKPTCPCLLGPKNNTPHLWDIVAAFGSEGVVGSPTIISVAWQKKVKLTKPGLFFS